MIGATASGPAQLPAKEEPVNLIGLDRKELTELLV